MSNAVSVQKAAVVSKEEMVGWLTRHLEQQSESVRASDKLMKRLEVASLILPVAALVVAIVLIATSSASLSESIPAAVFGVWGCLAPCIFLIGLHSVVIRAFPPVRYLMTTQTEKSPGFFVGGTAVGMGVYIMLAALVFAACSAMGAYAFFNPDILTVLIPVIIVFSVGSGLCGTWRRKQTI
jgi:hypothetical protein